MLRRQWSYALDFLRFYVKTSVMLRSWLSSVLGFLRFYVKDVSDATLLTCFGFMLRRQWCYALDLWGRAHVAEVALFFTRILSVQPCLTQKPNIYKWANVDHFLVDPYVSQFPSGPNMKSSAADSRGVSPFCRTLPVVTDMSRLPPFYE